MDYDLLENVAKTENTFCGDNQHSNKLHSQRNTVNIIARIHRTSCLVELAFLLSSTEGFHICFVQTTLLLWWWWTLRKKSFFLFFASWFNPTGKTSITAQLTT